MGRAKKVIHIFDPTIPMEERLNDIVKTHNQIGLNMRELIKFYKLNK